MSNSVVYCAQCKKQVSLKVRVDRGPRGVCSFCMGQTIIGPMKTATPTLLPTTAVSDRLRRPVEWEYWGALLFFVLSCLVFGYVVYLRI